MYAYLLSLLCGAFWMLLVQDAGWGGIGPGARGSDGAGHPTSHRENGCIVNSVPNATERMAEGSTGVSTRNLPDNIAASS